MQSVNTSEGVRNPKERENRLRCDVSEKKRGEFYLLSFVSEEKIVTRASDVYI